MRNPLLFALLSLTSATAAYGQDVDPASGSLWAKARGCLIVEDRTACWREVADAWPPPAQAERPDTQAEPTETPPFLEEFVREGDAFSSAIKQAVDKLSAGDPPSEAIQALAILPVEDPPFVPNPLSDMTLAFGRLDAYALLLEIVEARGWPNAAAVVLAAWEADLPTDTSTVLSSGAVDLAGVLARRGDVAAVERVLATLEPKNAPRAVTTLIEHGRLDAAAAIARRMTVEARQAGLQAESAELTERYRTRILPFMRAALAAELGPDLADQTMAAEDASTIEAMQDADWPERARDEVADARISLLNAADLAGRADLADPLALALWEEPVRRDWTGANTLVASLQYLVRPEATDGAARLVEAEQRLGARDRKLFPLRVLYDGWLGLGRQDQADALLDRWRAYAARQPRSDEASIGVDLAEILIARDEAVEAERLPAFDVLMLLRHDVAAGIGAARLDERLAGRAIGVQHSMLIDCGGAGHISHFDVAETCVRRRMNLSSPLTPLEQWGIAQRLVDIGTRYARDGDRARGEALIAEGLAFSAGPPDFYIASDIALDAALESVTGPLVEP